MSKNSYYIQLWADEGDVIIKSEDDYDITGKKMKIFLEPGDYKQGYFYPFLKVKKKLTFNEESKNFEIYMICDSKIKILADERNSKNLLEIFYETHDAQVRVISNFFVNSSGEIYEYEH